MTASLEARLAALRDLGLIGGLTDELVDELIDELFDGDREGADLLSVLDGFYEADVDRARGDGYLRHDWRFGQETDDVLAEIAERLPGAPVPRQLRWSTRSTIERGHRETRSTLHVALADGGERAVDIDSLDDVVALVNELVAQAGDPRRLYALQTDGDWCAYFALTANQARAIAPILPLRALGA